MEIVRRRVMRGPGFHPEGCFRQQIAEHRDLVTHRVIAEAGADDQFPAGCDPRADGLEKLLLLGGIEKLEDIEDADISKMLGSPIPEIVWRK